MEILHMKNSFIDLLTQSSAARRRFCEDLLQLFSKYKPSDSRILYGVVCVLLSFVF